MIDNLIEKVDNIESSIRNASSFIYHSTPMTAYSKGPQLDLKDIVGVIGPSTGRNILLNGSTGIAKTHLALACLTGLYGRDNFGILQIDPSLEAEKLFDLDGEKLQQGLLSEAIKNTKLITSPGVLLDEVMRAPQAILNILQAYMNNQAVTPSGGGSRQVGIEIPGIGFYQFKIGTCNEGKEFDEGTFNIDPAFRRRWPIEISLNLFAPNQYDMEQRSKAARTGTGLYVSQSEGVFEDIKEIHTNLNKISFHPVANEFLAYLGRMDNCIKAVFKTKRERGFSVEKCDGCHARGLAGKENFCGNVYAPEAPHEDIANVARGFALVRAHHIAASSGKMPKSLEVSFADVLQSFPFVCATKMGLDPAWLEKSFASGEPFEAAKALTINIEQKIMSKVKSLGKLMLKKDYTPDELAQIKKYSEEDPWSVGLRDFESVPVQYKGLR
ncbi:AAA family ATPase [Candidatus Woesearchaeota archaeon]|nr:AAA family ATPase [Candidatus Woesearchaeota archaeon]